MLNFEEPHFHFEDGVYHFGSKVGPRWLHCAMVAEQLELVCAKMGGLTPEEVFTRYDDEIDQMALSSYRRGKIFSTGEVLIEEVDFWFLIADKD